MSNKLFLKSLKKPRKYHIILFLIIFISIIFINTVTLFYEALLDMKYNDTKYGTYHGVLFNMEQDKIDSLSKEGAVEKIIPIERNVFNASDGTGLYLDAVPEDYFDFTEYYLTSGRFPQNHNEICCESSFLYMRGLTQNNFLGSTIKLGDIDYIVTGTFASNRIWSTLPSYTVQCFTSSPENVNAVAFSLKDINRCDAVVSKYEKYSVYCEYNMNHWAIERNTYENRQLYAPLLTVMLAVMLAVFIHIVSMLFMYHKTNIGVLGLIGISKKNIRKCLFISIFKTILYGGLTGGLCSILLIAPIKKIYEYTYSSDVSSFIYKKGLLTLLLSLILCAIYIFALLILIIIKTRKINMQNVRNENSIKIKKRVSEEKITNYIIAKRNIKNMKLSNVLSFITICFLICLIPVFKLYFSSVNQDVKMYDGFDYVAEIDKARISGYNKTAIDNYMSTIINPVVNNCTAIPIYSTSCELTVYKETISDEYAQLLKNDYNYQFEMSNNFTDTINAPFIMVGITKERQNQLNIKLNDNEAIAYRNVLNDNGNIVGVKLENYSSLQIDENSSLEIIGVKNNYDDLMPSSQVANVLILNMDTYIKLFGNSPVPSRIFYKVSDESRNELTQLFAEKSFIKLKNISEIKGNNRHLNICSSINLFLIILTFFFLLINCSITAYLTIQRNIKEYAIMSAIGISNWNISIMIIYQVCGVIVSSLVVSDILAFIITSSYYDELLLLSRVHIPMPYSEIIISNIIVIATCILICRAFLSRFWKLASNLKLHN